MKQLTLTEVEPDGEQCPTCGELFDSEYGVAAHHWQAHDVKLGVVEYECDHCGERNEKPRSDLYETNFCDDECMYAYQQGENHPTYNSETRSCSNCGSDVTRCVAHFGEYPMCSRECYSEWLSEVRSGPGSPLWERERVECEYCGVDIWRKPCQLDGRTHCCSKECRVAWVKSKSSPASLVTAVRRSLSSLAWGTVADSYREQHETDCEMCGEETTAGGQATDLHHIIPVDAGGCNTDDLLMPLCRSCHRKAEAYTRDIPEVESVLIEE